MTKKALKAPDKYAVQRRLALDVPPKEATVSPNLCFTTLEIFLAKINGVEDVLALYAWIYNLVEEWI